MRRSAFLLRKAGVIQESNETGEFDSMHLPGKDNVTDSDTKYIVYADYKRHFEYNNNMPLERKDLAAMLSLSDHGPCDAPTLDSRTVTGQSVVDLEINGGA